MKSDDSFTEIGIIEHREGTLIDMVATERASANLFISITGAGRNGQPRIAKCFLVRRFSSI